jgi:hypothetical protein
MIAESTIENSMLTIRDNMMVFSSVICYVTCGLFHFLVI